MARPLGSSGICLPVEVDADGAHIGGPTAVWREEAVFQSPVRTTRSLWQKSSLIQRAMPGFTRTSRPVGQTLVLSGLPFQMRGSWTPTCTPTRSSYNSGAHDLWQRRS